MVSILGSCKGCYPVLLVYITRAWVAPPPTARHRNKYLQGARDFSQEEFCLAAGFGESLSTYLHFVTRGSEKSSVLVGGLMVE